MLPGQLKIRTTAENILSAELHDAAVVPGRVSKEQRHLEHRMVLLLYFFRQK